MANNWQVDLLENNLVISSSSKLVLSPPCGKACLEVKEFFWLGKADSVYVGLKVKVLRDIEDSPVVGEVPWVELRVDVEGLDVSVLVGAWALSGSGCPILHIESSAWLAPAGTWQHSGQQHTCEATLRIGTRTR